MGSVWTQTGSRPQWLTTVLSGSAGGYWAGSARTTASCSPSPEEYQGGRRYTRIPPVRRLTREPSAFSSRLQVNVGSTETTTGAAGGAELGTSTVVAVPVRVTRPGWSVISAGKQSRKRLVAIAW